MNQKFFGARILVFLHQKNFDIINIFSTFVEIEKIKF